MPQNNTPMEAELLSTDPVGLAGSFRVQETAGKGTLNGRVFIPGSGYRAGTWKHGQKSVWLDSVLEISQALHLEQTLGQD